LLLKIINSQKWSIFWPTLYYDGNRTCTDDIAALVLLGTVCKPVGIRWLPATAIHQQSSNTMLPYLTCMTQKYNHDQEWKVTRPTSSQLQLEPLYSGVAA